MTQTDDIPRWAQSLGTETWEKIGELLHEGWDLSDLMRTLQIPEPKRRSLQVYARKFGPRRRLLMFATFKDALLQGAVDMGPEFAEAMTLIAKSAVSEGVKPSTQQRACELMANYAKTLAGLMQGDAEAEQQRERDETGSTRSAASTEKLSHEAMAKIKGIYGLPIGGSDA